MTEAVWDNPLTGPIPGEVNLSRAPLELVVAQVRFPLIASIGNADFIGPFQEAIRSQYPVLRAEETREFAFAQSQLLPSKETTLWRFHDVADFWRVTLAPTFLALETRKYSDRSDFISRFHFLSSAVAAHFSPTVRDRLGIRYLDRIVSPELEDLPLLVRTEVLGVLGTQFGFSAHHAVSDSVFNLPMENGRLRSRWGTLPQGVTIDPASILPVEHASWILDIDAFIPEQGQFEPESLRRDLLALAERSYAFFRWAISPDFLSRFGG